MAAGHISNTRNEDLPKKKRKKKFEDNKSGTDDENGKPLPYTTLFRYATSLDKFLMVIGLLSALIHGAAMPFMLLILGRITDTFVEFASCSQNITSTNDYTGNLTISNCSLDGNMTGVITESSLQLGERITPFAWYYVIVACTLMVTGFFQVFTLSLSSTRQVKCIRHMFFRSVMRQEMEWMESKEVGKLNVRLNDDVTKIGMAIGDRMAFFINGVSAAVFGLAIGFATGWKLTLIVLAIVPVLGISIMLHRKYVTKWTAKEISAYGDAGALVYNVLRNIRTVVAYGAEEREVERYNEKLSDAEKQGVRKGILLGGFQGFIWCLLLSSYALALWYGSNLALDPNTDFTIGRLMTVLFAVLLAAFNTGNAFTNFDVFLVGRCAAAGVLRVIDRESKIDPLTTDGLTLKDINGDLEFCNVCFSYPQRLVQKILEDFNATFCPGQIYAVTGPSGTGKSTIVKLMQRLYDPTSGKITLDGKNITDLNVRWYRRKIAVVQQEPTLFATTISENIKLGSDDVSDDDVINATKAANAYEFIESLPEKFQTLVGVGGCQLSGGQKQRIAIARALVRKPKILLLDQACSALDTHSEAVVLENLIQNRSDRTTILVAHRQSTIKIADHVVEIKYQTNATKEAVKTIDETLHENNIYIAEGSENLSYVNEAFASNEHHADENKNKLKTSDKTNSNTLTDGEHRKKSISSDGQSLNFTEISTEEEEVPPGTFRRVLKINMEEWYYIVFGCVGSLLNGTTQPAFAVLLSAVLGVHAMLDNSTKSDYINFYCALMTGLAGLSFVSHFLQFSMFAKSGEILTRKIRKMTFSSILKQEMSWFDKQDIESTSLPDRLAIDAGEIQGAAGAQVGFAVSVFTAVFLALFISLYSGWKLALLQIAFFPLVVGAHAAQSRMLHSSNQRDQKKLEEAGKIFLETLSSFETVAQLGKEEHFASKYENTLLFISENGKKTSLIQGAVYGFASSVIYFSYAATFRYGATLLGNDEINLENLFRVFFVIMCAGIQLGRSYRHMPDVGKAKKSANRIFKIIDRKPTIGVNAEAQTPNRFNGDIQLKSCEFTYSTRKECKVLRNLDIGVESGKTLALVGRSGCGKSTIVQLIQRFYDPDGGAVLIDGLDAKEYNLKYLRSKIGVVFQDPVLFEGTVYDNIVYGDCGKTLSFEEVEEAAKTANIHDFITGLEKGYQTEVGKGGNRFSRGEKQRIAIARSLVRNPAILLLDEATSSLDNENEAIVQEALDRARQGRTSIMIAHRLSTIKNANKIAVMSKGEIMESGTHDTLLEKRGLYFGMVNASATKS